MDWNRAKHPSGHRRGHAWPVSSDKNTYHKGKSQAGSDKELMALVEHEHCTRTGGGSKMSAFEIQDFQTQRPFLWADGL